MAEKAYNVGIYCRLSNDDERDGESVSIENQKLLLQRYVRERGWNEIDIYIDDGYSGTNFQRPGVQRLIADAKAGRINVILVKDLSRFGRTTLSSVNTPITCSRLSGAGLSHSTMASTPCVMTAAPMLCVF